MKKLVINKSDLIYNINKLKTTCGKTKIIAVLKGNGYGLGITAFADILIQNGISFFAVNELCEAVILKNAGFDSDILLMTPTNDENEARIIAEHGIIATIGGIRHARLLDSVGAAVRVHVKIDTGFGRFGFDENNIEDGAGCLKSLENLHYDGVFSHFSDSFNKKSGISKKQYDLFEKCVAVLNLHGINPKMRHICNSCGVLTCEYAYLDAVRIGSAFLGRLPIKDPLGLRKIAHLHSEVVEIYTLSKGKNIGYANTYTTTKDTELAVIPAGYRDGFGVEKSKDTFRVIDVLRYTATDVLSLGKRIYVSIYGKKVPIIGRNGMCNVIADVTGLDVKVGDCVVLECNPILVDSAVEREFRI